MSNLLPQQLSPLDQDRMRTAAEILLTARRTLVPIQDLPLKLRPRNLEEAYYLQDLVLEALGQVGGWKVGGKPDATPLYAPIPYYSIAKSGTLIADTFRRIRGVEGEIAFLIGKDLPPRPNPYTREEVIEAIQSCHPAIELLESGLLDPDAADRLTTNGDLQLNGGLIYGDSAAGWQDFDFNMETAQMIVDGVVRVEDGKSAGGGDLIRLVLWMANEAQHRTGGLKAGQWITTGSWTGKLLAEKGSECKASFSRFGSVVTRFE